MWERIWINGRLATLSDAGGYGLVEPGAIAVENGHIIWLGQQADLPAAPETLAQFVHDLEGRWVTPGLIDCHTHLVYGGNRAAEFEQRLKGASYAEIAAAGGGIVSTVKATRAASEDDLFSSAQRQLETLLSEGVTTVEIKSGYGLDLENEIKQLRVARRLGEVLPVDVKTTFLGAHAVPPEFEGDSERQVDAVVAMMPEISAAGLADAVDAFCEKIAFTPEQTARVFAAAQSAGLPVKLHADQLSDLGGAALAAKFGALSADHLEYTNEAGVIAMAKAGTVAVMLPGAFYVLGETQLPPLAAFRAAGVPLALATDSNPGSSPITSLLLILNMACTLFRMTPEEALAGVTRNAAKALGLADTHGTLEVGKVADLAVWNIEHPAELAYRIGFNPLAFAVKNGKPRAL